MIEQKISDPEPWTNKILCRYRDAPPVKQFLRDGEDRVLVAEITRLRQLLSEAEKREREGLERIANMADTEAARLLERWTSDQGATPDTKAAGVASHLITDFGAEVLAMLSKLERRAALERSEG